jgi:hypothetical protein
MPPLKPTGAYAPSNPVVKEPPVSRIVHISQGKLISENGNAIPSDAFENTAALGVALGTDAGLISGGQTVTAISALLKAAYTATSPKSATTLYITTDTGGIFLGSTTIVAGS